MRFFVVSLNLNKQNKQNLISISMEFLILNSINKTDNYLRHGRQAANHRLLVTSSDSIEAWNRKLAIIESRKSEREKNKWMENGKEYNSSEKWVKNGK